MKTTMTAKVEVTDPDPVQALSAGVKQLEAEGYTVTTISAYKGYTMGGTDNRPWSMTITGEKAVAKDG